MVQLSEAFSLIGINGCMDTATSLFLQGTVPDISIPIYEIFNLKVLSAQNSNFIADNMAEYNALRVLSESCGGVLITINVLNIDMLTLLEGLCIYTPSTGMSVFIKSRQIPVENIGFDILQNISNLLGVEIPSPDVINISFIENIIQELINRLINTLQSDLNYSGIALRSWDELEDFYTSINLCGDIKQMHMYRANNNGMTF